MNKDEKNLTNNKIEINPNKTNTVINDLGKYKYFLIIIKFY